VVSTLQTKDLEYELPEGRIATRPAQPRSSAKMLVLNRGAIEDVHVSNLPNYIPADSLLVVNETSVLPARFKARRLETGGRVEGLYLDEESDGWLVMLKSNGKLRDGLKIEIAAGVELELVKKKGKHWVCRCSSDEAAIDVLQRCGTTPIPPYILKARGDEEIEDTLDREHYQTVYADEAQCASVAAPTAGLHFDHELLQALEARGIERVPVTLHVGAGTFKGIETDDINAHVMHSEAWSVSESSLTRIKASLMEQKPIIAVGTTTVRTLESLPPLHTWPERGGLAGHTTLMISPPYDFAIVDGILTNFHLPKSTLLALVAAKIGIERLHEVYGHAISNGYRFYSYGDAMFILP